MHVLTRDRESEKSTSPEGWLPAVHSPLAILGTHAHGAWFVFQVLGPGIVLSAM